MGMWTHLVRGCGLSLTQTGHSRSCMMALSLGEKPHGSVFTSRAPSVIPQWPLVSDPTSPRENDKMGLTLDQWNISPWDGSASTTIRGAQGQWRLKSPETWLTTWDRKARFELSVIWKFRGNVFNTLWKVMRICMSVYIYYSLTRMLAPWEWWLCSPST